MNAEEPAEAGSSHSAADAVSHPTVTPMSEAVSDGFYTNPVVRFELTQPVDETNQIAAADWALARGASAAAIPPAPSAVALVIDSPKGEVTIHYGDRVAYNDMKGFQAVPEWRMDEFQRLDLEERPDADSPT